MDFWFRLSLRTRLGIIGAGFIAIAIMLLVLWWFVKLVFVSFYQIVGILLLGLLIGLLWLAWDDLRNIPWWHWLIIVALLFACAFKPPFWFIAAPIIGYILFKGRKAR